MRQLSRLLAVTMLLTLVLLAGCVAHSPFMRESAARQPPKPSANAKSHFAVAVPPGDHVFLTWGENTAALRASLLPGRTYFVEVSAKMGWMKARAHLLAIAPRTKSWQQVQEWLAETDAYEPDLAAGQAKFDAEHDDTQDHIHAAYESLRDYDQGELDDRTLRPDDGT
jgi:hypothetical protein